MTTSKHDSDSGPEGGRGKRRNSFSDFIAKVQVGGWLHKRDIDKLGTLHDVPPRIAVIGEAGVRKSSTINSLFSPSPPLGVGYVSQTTISPRPLLIPEKETMLSTDDGRGDIIVVDFPGLGASLKSDEIHIPVYQTLLPTCDVAIWIIDANDRAYANIQLMIRDVLPKSVRKRLVIGINKIDVIHPNDWIDEFNVPSRSQEQSIETKLGDVNSILSDVCKIKKGRIV